MGFLKKLGSLFTGPSSVEPLVYWVYVQCDKCGEKIRSRVDLRNDVSAEYGGSDVAQSYFTRKTIIGEQRCYAPINIELTFSNNRKLTDKQISGGKFITAEEYEAGA